MRNAILKYVSLLLAVTGGCGGAEFHSAPRTAARMESVADYSVAPMAAEPSSEFRRQETAAFAGMTQPAFPGEPGTEPLPPTVPRKIIYNADIRLVVEDFEQTEAEVTRLVEASGGYIADLNVSGSPGSVRSAQWKLRIPVEGFEAFLREILKLGELEANRRTSEDVTEQYFDLEARIKNKTVEEQRLIQILEETTGKLEDVLKVETELSRVRGEIEQLQGRLRLLANLTSLTTVTLNVRERQKFEPPPPVAPDFPTQIERTFQESYASLVRLGERVALFAVDWALWIPILLIGFLIGLLVVRIVLGVAFRLIRRAWASANPRARARSQE